MIIQNRRVIILAAKDISQNRRVPLLARYFADKGARVDVFAFTLAHSHYADERITFHAVPVRFFAAQFLEWLETSQGKPENPWRPRLGNKAVLGYAIGLAEVMKYRQSADALTNDTVATGTRRVDSAGVVTYRKDYSPNSVGTGPNGGRQSQVKVHQNSKGVCHGHPCGPEN